MHRVVREQIGVTLFFEVAAACVALIIAAIVKILGCFWSVPIFLQASFFRTWLWPFIVLSAVVVLLNIWRFVGKVGDIKKLAQKFGSSFDDMAEAIYKYRFKEVMENLSQNPKYDFKDWLEEKRQGTTTVFEEVF